MVKALFAAFADRDLVAASTVLDHEVEIRPGLVGGLEGTVYRGLSGNEQFWTDIDATWVEFRIEPHEFRDLWRASAHPGTSLCPRARKRRCP